MLATAVINVPHLANDSRKFPIAVSPTPAAIQGPGHSFGICLLARRQTLRHLDLLRLKTHNTQEADSPKCSKSMPKVVVGVPWVLKVFSWVFIYKVHKKIGLGPKKSVKPD